MKLSELILHIGDANVLVEPLNNFLITAKGKSDHSIITVRSNVIKASDWLGGTESHIGLMVWLPKDKLPKQEAHQALAATEEKG
jgi:hypothetical protein